MGTDRQGVDEDRYLPDRPDRIDGWMGWWRGGVVEGWLGYGVSV